MKHPFAVGVGVGIVGLVAWWQRGRIRALFHRIGHLAGLPPAGLMADIKPSGNAYVDACARHAQRYAFASLQDKSPVAGLTHASYAMTGLDLLEEAAGTDGAKHIGIDIVAVRPLVAKLQDYHASRLRECDPYLAAALLFTGGSGVAPNGA